MPRLARGGCREAVGPVRGGAARSGSAPYRAGGFYSCLDREGNVYDTSKQGWMQARDYCKLRDFLARVQIASKDPRLDGAWMRAYDMDIDEWHGLNKDLGWGPYCIESGWTTGTIPAVFLFDVREESYF